MEAVHLEAKFLITKQDDVAKRVDLDVSVILAEHTKNPVFVTVQSGLGRGIQSEAELPEIQHSKGLLRNCRKIDQPLIEQERQLLCYIGPFEKLEEENFRICLPLSFFLAFFTLRYYNEMGGHMGASKPYNNP